MEHDILNRFSEWIDDYRRIEDPAMRRDRAIGGLIEQRNEIKRLKKENKKLRKKIAKVLV